MADLVKEKGRPGRKDDFDYDLDLKGQGTNGNDAENTYQLEPHDLFPFETAQDILKDVLTNELKHKTYDSENPQGLAANMCDKIKNRLRDLNTNRYRLVVQVFVGQNTGQGVQISSSFLWDESTDTTTSYFYKNDSLFGVAVMYAIYFN